MPAAGTLYHPTVSSLPVSVPRKTPYYPPAPVAPASYSRIATSPPSVGSSVRTSAVPSLTSGSYAGSHSDASEHAAPAVDLMDMMTDRLSSAVNPLPMDKSIARQAQTSGELNAKQRELAELQALAQRRLKSTRANLADGMKAAKEVRRDLEWTQKRVSALNSKAAAKYPSAHKTASSRYPTPMDC